MFCWPDFGQSAPDKECGPLLAPSAIFDLRADEMRLRRRRLWGVSCISSCSSSSKVVHYGCDVHCGLGEMRLGSDSSGSLICVDIRFRPSVRPSKCIFSSAARLVTIPQTASPSRKGIDQRFVLSYTTLRPRYTTRACVPPLIASGGASAVKEPGHFEVRKSSSQIRSPMSPGRREGLA